MSEGKIVRLIHSWRAFEPASLCPSHPSSYQTLWGPIRVPYHTIWGLYQTIWGPYQTIWGLYKTIWVLGTLPDHLGTLQDFWGPYRPSGDPTGLLETIQASLG